MITRFIAVSLAILFIGYLLPGFSIIPFSTAVLGGFFIAGLGYLIETVALKKEALPYTHGVVGFTATTLGLIVFKVLLLTINISWLGLILTSLIIGLVDLIIPSSLK